MLLVPALGLCACGARPIDPWPGRSTAPAADAKQVAKQNSIRVRWESYDILGSLALARQDAVSSQNHGPFQWNMLVRVIPSALQSYLNWHRGNTMPVDVWLVAEHRSRNGSTQGPYYFAHKTANGWNFGSATADGWLLPATNACTACHSEAPADNLFGFVPTAPALPGTKRPDGG